MEQQKSALDRTPNEVVRQEPTKVHVEIGVVKYTPLSLDWDIRVPIKSEKKGIPFGQLRSITVTANVL